MIKNRQIFNIRETAETLVPDKLGRSSYLVSLALVLIMFSLITLMLGSLPPSVPLYFTLPWGEARLAPKLMLYILPTITLILIVFNLGLGRLSGKLSPLLPRVLAVSTSIIAGMMLISLLGICNHSYYDYTVDNIPVDICIYHLFGDNVHYNFEL